MENYTSPYEEDVKAPFVDPYAIPESAVSRIQGMIDAPLRAPGYDKTPALPSQPQAIQTQPQGLQTDFVGPSRAHQKSWVGDQGSGMTKTVDEAGKTTYTGIGKGGDEAQEMQSRGMVKDYNGNWMPQGGWEAQVPTEQRTRYFDNPAMNTPPKPDIGAMSISEFWQHNRDLKDQRAATAQQGQMALGAQREQGSLRRLGAEYGFRREEAKQERSALKPHREAQTGEAQARTKLLGTQEEAARLGMVDAQEYAELRAIMNNKELAKTDPVLVENAKARLKAIEEKKMRQQIAVSVAKAQAMNQTGPYAEDVVHDADGGFIEGYADGGAIGRAQTQQLNPLVSQYGQYLQAAAQTGVAPVPFAQYINLLGSTRGAMQQTPSQFADGGDVSALSRPLEGPGTGRSDSIPAIIDGIKPAALSRGEFVLDEETTKYYGTKFLMDLQRKAKEALAGGGEGEKAPANG